VRLIAVLTCGSIALLVFLAMLGAIARHRARLCINRAYGATAVAEYVWAAIPWLMIVACAVPAVRLLVAGPECASDWERAHRRSRAGAPEGTVDALTANSQSSSWRSVCYM